jgi:hypothetical protein
MKTWNWLRVQDGVLSPGSTDHSIVSVRLNSVKITNGIGNFSKNPRARVTATISQLAGAYITQGYGL